MAIDSVRIDAQHIPAGLDGRMAIPVGPFQASIGPRNVRIVGAETDGLAKFTQSVIETSFLIEDEAERHVAPRRVRLRGVKPEHLPGAIGLTGFLVGLIEHKTHLRIPWMTVTKTPPHWQVATDDRRPGFKRFCTKGILSR